MRPVSGLTWGSNLTNDQDSRLLDEVCALVRDLELMPQVDDLSANLVLNRNVDCFHAVGDFRIELTPAGLRTTGEGQTHRDYEGDLAAEWRAVEPRPTTDDELRHVVRSRRIESSWPLDMMERIAL